MRSERALEGEIRLPGRVTHQRPVRRVGVGQARRRDARGLQFVQELGRAGVRPERVGVPKCGHVPRAQPDRGGRPSAELRRLDLPHFHLADQVVQRRRRRRVRLARRANAGHLARVRPPVADAAEVEDDELDASGHGVRGLAQLCSKPE